MRRFLASATLLLLTAAHATPLHDLTTAQQQIIAYLPALKNQSIAKALKDAANRGITTYLIAPPQAHLASDTYLLSVALAAAQTPPAPLTYHRATLPASPFLIIDNRVLYLGPGVQSLGQVVTGTPAQLASAVKLTAQVIQNTPATPIPKLIEEKYLRKAKK